VACERRISEGIVREARPQSLPCLLECSIKVNDTGKESGIEKGLDASSKSCPYAVQAP